tara:strand:- start:4070 stop:4633 length:564 start_codon:yes stop_codon:yes gene_type:complete
MLYFSHHPAGNVVIRTNNPYIVLQHQGNGWLTTTSWEEVLQDHPEWRSPEAPQVDCHAGPPKSLATLISKAFLGLLSPTITLVSTFTPSGGQTTSSLLALGSSSLDQENDETGKAHQKQPSNAGPVHWLTAIERKWYYERGLTTPVGAWIMCTEGDEAFDYLLITGVCELDVAPPYESGGSSKDDTV